MNLKLIVLAIIIFVLPHYSKCQNIRDLFLMLPPECTPELGTEGRKILIEERKYRIPGGDSEETVEYSMVSEGKDYLEFDYDFTTGQRAYIQFQIRQFKRNDGSEILIYSKCGAFPSVLEQEELLSFDVKKGRLKPVTNLIPPTPNLLDFFNKGTPDSIKNKLNNYYSGCFNLHFSESQNIEYDLGYEIAFADPWMLGDYFEYIWDGKKFKKSEMKTK